MYDEREKANESQDGSPVSTLGGQSSTPSSSNSASPLQTPREEMETEFSKTQSKQRHHKADSLSEVKKKKRKTSKRSHNSNEEKEEGKIKTLNEEMKDLKLNKEKNESKTTLKSSEEKEKNAKNFNEDHNGKKKGERSGKKEVSDVEN
jgi:hypothetical protein